MYNMKKHLQKLTFINNFYEFSQLQNDVSIENYGKFRYKVQRIFATGSTNGENVGRKRADLLNVSSNLNKYEILIKAAHGHVRHMCEDYI